VSFYRRTELRGFNSCCRTKVPDTLLRIGSNDSAKAAYLDIVSSILGSEIEVPISSDGGVVYEQYGSLSNPSKVDLVAAFIGLAECEKKSKDEERVCSCLPFKLTIYIVNLPRRFYGSRKFIWSISTLVGRRNQKFTVR